MIFKKKSLVVGLVSGAVVSLVLILTLASYSGYLEIKHEKFKRYYSHMLHKTLVGSCMNQVNVSSLMVKIEDSGPLKGYPVLEGSIKNNGTRTVADILLRARLLDKSGASMYEVVFRPQEPSLGRSGLAEISIPYINHSNRTAVKPGSSMPFKKILRECPKEIMGELERARSSGRVMYSMPDNISCEILSLEV